MRSGTPNRVVRVRIETRVPAIDNGRNYRRLNIEPGPERLWRITCFFVDRDYRKKGVASLALNAALDSIKTKGGGAAEAYPVRQKTATAWVAMVQLVLVRNRIHVRG